MNSSPAPDSSPRAKAPGTRILIVEDEPGLLRALRINFRARGYDVAAAGDGKTALAQMSEHPPDAVLLDLGLPDLDGVELIGRFRRLSDAPLIVLSGRTGSDDRMGALDAGADDYVTKPFSVAELLVRLRAALTRDEQRSAIPIRIGRNLIDLAARTILAAPGPGSAAKTADVHLTDTEWRLLEVLLNAPGQLVSTERLLTEIFGGGPDEDTDQRIRFQMARLRRKLEDDPPRPRHLLTEPGIGYRYQP